jgi:uncharacterized protein
LDLNKEHIETSVQRIWSEAEIILRRESGGHSLQHSKRVLELCLRIAEEEREGDPFILQAVAILHDIAIPVSGRKDHAKESAKIAEKILKRIDFPEKNAERVLYTIKTHRFSDKKTPNTVEAKIFQDADRLDAIGAIGIARCFAFGGRKERALYDKTEVPDEYDPEKEVSSLTHIKEKLLKIKDSLHTTTAKRIAEERHQFTIEFIERLALEIQGENNTSNIDKSNRK